MVGESFERLKQHMADIREGRAQLPLDLPRSKRRSKKPKRGTRSITFSKADFKIGAPADRAHKYKHVDVLTGCRICGRGPGFYIHKILPGPRGHNLSTYRGTRSIENKIYNESKAIRERRQASFTKKVIHRRKGNIHA